MGYYTIEQTDDSGPSYYYDPDLPAISPQITAKAGDDVTVAAHERAGYRFVGWEGTGTATHRPLGIGAGITASLEDRNNPITCDTITVRMHQSRTVRAVFELARKALVVTGGVKCSSDTFGALGAAGALGTMKWQVVPVGSPPTAQEILEKIPKCSVFAYNGHGSPECLGLEYSGCDYNLLGQCTCDVTKSLCVGAISATPKSPYRLVYMTSCGAGANWMGWVEAFNYASAFVGFTESVFNDVAESFDRKFWAKVRSGENTFEAASAAVGEVDEEEHLSGQKLDPIKKFVGSTMLSGCN